MSSDKAGLPTNEKAAEKAKAYWAQNEQKVCDICKFEGLKGVVYELFRYITGAPVDLNFDLTYPLPRYGKEPSYANEITIEFDGAEGGAVWIQEAETDEMIAIRGPEAMRELARMLAAFADSYPEADQ